MEKSEKILNKKTIIAIIATILVFLLLIFIILPNFYQDTSSEREKAILSYLQDKYNSNFEILGLESQKQYEENFNIDASEFTKKVWGKYEYYYNVLSTTDNVEFIVYLLDDNGKFSCNDSYKINKKYDTTIQQLQNYTTSLIGKENIAKITFQADNYSDAINGKLKVQLNKGFESIVNRSFLSNLDSINNYIYRIEKDINNNITEKNDMGAKIKVYLYDSESEYSFVPIFGIEGSNGDYSIYHKSDNKELPTNKSLNDYL